MGGCQSRDAPVAIESSLVDQQMNAMNAAAAGQATQQASIAIAVAAGTGLLNAAGQIPFIAPIAYLIGATVVACEDAEGLKQDCKEFSVCVQELENDLLKVDDLKKHKQTIEALQELLEEGYGFVKALKNSNKFIQVLASHRNTSALVNIRDRMVVLLQTMTFTVTLDLKRILSAKFDEEEKLGDLVEKMGGLDVALKNQNDLEQIKECLSHPEKVMMAMQEQAILKHNIVHEDLKRAHSEIVSKQEETQRKIAVESQKQAEMLKIQNEILMRQVMQMNAMQMQMQEFMSRLPISPLVHERVYTIQELQLQKLPPISEVDDILEELVIKYGKRFCVSGALVNILDDETQFTLGFRMTHPVDKDLLGRNANDEIIKLAKQLSTCQYCVESDSMICVKRNNLEKHDNLPMDSEWLDNDSIQNLSSINGLFGMSIGLLSGEWAQRVREYFMSCPRDASLLISAREYAVSQLNFPLHMCRVLETIGYLVRFSKDLIYLGTPIKIKGVCIGVLCCYLCPHDFGKSEEEIEKLLKTEGEIIMNAMNLENCASRIATLLEIEASSPAHQKMRKTVNSE